MKTAICDSRTPKKALKNLQNYCDRVLLLPKFKMIAEPVSAHPDMLIFPCPEQGFLFTHSDYAEIAGKELRLLGLNIVEISEKVQKNYPDDILLNAAKVGKFLIGRIPYISKELRNFCKNRNLTMIDVKQGYAKCSICTVSENSIVTADPSIEYAAKKNQIDVLKISPGGILLPGYDQGFLGGASGSDKENVYFCGDISTHPDGDRIMTFCKGSGKTPISLSDEPLFDVGSIFIIET